MNTWIIFVLAFMQAAEVFEHLCAICLERVPNVRYQHGTNTHLAVCSNCDDENENQCLVCKQVIIDRELISEGEKKALKRRIKRAKEKEQSAQRDSALRIAQEEKEKADEAKREEEETNKRKALVQSLYQEASNFAYDGDLKSVELRVTEALELDPQNVKCLILFGYVLLAYDRLDEALHKFEMSLCSIESEHDLFCVNIAKMLEVRGFYPQALDFLVRIKNVKEIPPTPFAFAMAYYLLMGNISRLHLRKYGLAKKYYNNGISLMNINEMEDPAAASAVFAEILLGLKEIEKHYAEEEK